MLDAGKHIPSLSVLRALTLTLLFRFLIDSVRHENQGPKHMLQGALHAGNVQKPRPSGGIGKTKLT